MTDEKPLQDAVKKLLETAQRCRRLANSITDRATTYQLLNMAEQCDAKAAELRKQTSQD